MRIQTSVSNVLPGAATIIKRFQIVDSARASGQTTRFRNAAQPLWAAGAFSLLVASASCSLINEDDPLAGRTFAIQGQGDDNRIVTLVFENGDLTYSADCNTHTTGYEVDGGKLKVGRTQVTLVGCEEPESLLKLEDVLAAEPEIDVDDAGTLSLNAGQSNIEAQEVRAN